MMTLQEVADSVRGYPRSEMSYVFMLGMYEGKYGMEVVPMFFELIRNNPYLFGPDTPEPGHWRPPAPAQAHIQIEPPAQGQIEPPASTVPALVESPAPVPTKRLGALLGRKTARGRPKGVPNRKPRVSRKMRLAAAPPPSSQEQRQFLQTVPVPAARDPDLNPGDLVTLGWLLALYRQYASEGYEYVETGAQALASKLGWVRKTIWAQVCRLSTAGYVDWVYDRRQRRNFFTVTQKAIAFPWRFAEEL